MIWGYAKTAPAGRRNEKNVSEYESESSPLKFRAVVHRRPAERLRQSSSSNHAAEIMSGVTSMRFSYGSVPSLQNARRAERFVMPSQRRT